MKSKLKKWQVQNKKIKVSSYLMTHEVAFTYAKEQGVVFEASESFVEHMCNALVMVYGCSSKPIINEMK